MASHQDVSPDNAGNFYGIVGQSLTPDYLARQLPMFQQKVPRGNQTQFKFVTNAPPNLPSPPLYPGEQIQLQEHRIVCTDAFSEPAVGALYVTNYRIIFCGNLISDPDSLDALQDGDHSGKSVASVESISFSSKFRVSRPKTESSSKLSNFKSFIYPDQVVDDLKIKDETGYSQRIKSGLRRTIGSFRRSPKRLISKTATLPPTPTKSKSSQSDSDEKSNDVRRSRKPIFLNFDQDDVSLRSGSLSSLSEFSTTGTDDRSIQSPIRESRNGPTKAIDIQAFTDQNGGEHREHSTMPDSCFTADSSREVARSDYQLLENDINFMDPHGTRIEATTSHRLQQTGKGQPQIQVDSEEIDIEKHSKKPSRVPLLKAQSIDGVTPNLVKSSRNVLQKSITVDSPDTYLSSGCVGRRLWENSIVVIESDSDSEELSPRSVPLSDNLSFSSIPNEPCDGVVFVLGGCELDDRHSTDQTDQLVDTVTGPVYSKIEIIATRGDSDNISNRVSNSASSPSVSFALPSSSLPPGTSSLPPDISPLTSNPQPPTNPYANLVFGYGAKASDVLNSCSSSVKPSSRLRCMSSPKTAKKPKPSPQTAMSFDRGKAEIDKSSLVSSLPSNFKPLPPPKPPNLSISEDNCRERLLSPATEESSDGAIQSSPEHVENSLKMPTKDSQEISPAPVPPPRLKRKSKHISSSSQDSEASIFSLPTSLKNATIDMPAGENGGTRSHDQATGVINRSHDHAVCVNGSRNQSSDSLCKSSECFSEDDNVSPSAVSDKSPDDVYAVSDHTSLAVLNPASSPRPHSLISPTDLHSFVFNSRGAVPCSTMPRGGAISWSPNSAFSASKMDSRKSKKPVIPASTRYSLSISCPLKSVHTVSKLPPAVLKEQGLKLPEGLFVLCRNLCSMKLYIHPHNTYDAEALRVILERKFFAPKPLHELFAFKYYAAIHHPNPTFIGNRSMTSFFKLSGELTRLGLLDSKLWRVARLLTDHPDISPTYPPHLLMPICTPDMDIMRGASLYKEGRFPSLTWIHKNGAALLRSAATKEERGQGVSNQQVDEALLQAICGCNSNSKGPTTLRIYTEKGTSDNKHSSLKPDQLRTYYYHNCNFVYSDNPPTFKSVRHSFNKLQALLENQVPDEDYYLALDSTRWLQRVGEILSTTNSVCQSLCHEGSHVLVCFESGWDRTAQISSLAQLFADPFYRSMDGFQILIQKEWVWFGHPFRTRHSRQGKTKAKLDGPIFMQWVDCVWQVMHQCPSAFEFNERFLMSLVEESYSGKFGTFMTDCERERKQTFTEAGYQHKSVSTHTVSYWTWVAMVNAAGRTFYSELYDRSIHPNLLVALSTVPCLRVWTAHYNLYQKKWMGSLNLINPLQRQLEELVHTYKKLEEYEADFRPLTPTSPTCETSNVVLPPLMPRDEITATVEKPRFNGQFSPQVSRYKPVPPPKPAITNKQQVDSLEQYLLREGLDPSLCKHVELGQRICQGNLYKIGAVRKNWLQRWFVLDFDCQYLAYFESKTAYNNREAPKGVIRLGDIIKVYQNMKKREHMVKNIITIETGHRTYLIQAPSIITMDIWQICLKMHIGVLGEY